MISIRYTAVLKRPAGLSAVDAAAVWMQYLTAYGAKGDAVIITAASSSVGLAAIQIASRGRSVLWTGSSADGIGPAKTFCVNQEQSRRVLERRLDVLAFRWRHIYG